MRAFERKILEVSERAFLDDKIPVLDNRTPREAVADPALRAKLALLVKRRVNDTDFRNLKKGTARDIDWLPAELGLTELLFEAPPRRPIPKELGPR